MNTLDLINKLFFPWAEGFILLYGFLHLVDKQNFFKEKKLQTFICVTVFSSFSYWVLTYADYSIHTILIVAFAICLFSFITRTNLYASAMSLVAVFLLYGIIEVFGTVIILAITGVSLDHSINDPVTKLKMMSRIMPIQYLVFILLSRIKIKKRLFKSLIFNKQNHTISYMLLQLIAMLIFFISSSVKSSNNTILFTVLGSIFFLTAVLGLLDFKERLKMMNIEKQFCIQEEHIKNMEVVIDAIRKEKHDYVNQISALVAMCLVKDPDTLDKIEFYARKLINNSNSSSSYKFYDTGNKYLDGFLTVKSNKAVEKGISFEVDFDTPLDVVDIDEINLTSIIGNIVDNAFDAVLSDVHSDMEKIVSLYAYSEEDRYCISISNNGPRIPENNLKKIFENKFSTKAKYEGERGFGLFIVKELVSQHNGRISVTSTEDETEFLIEFKVKTMGRLKEAAAV